MLDFLHQLPPEASAALLAAARPLRLERGEVAFRPEDPAGAVFLIERGRVRLYRIGESAREVSLAVYGRGEVFGEAALAAGDLPCYEAYAEALEPSEVRCVPGEAMLAAMRTHPTLSVAFSAQLARQAKGIQGRLSDLVFLEVSQRLARTLLKLARDGGEADRTGTRLGGKVSHQDLAHLVGSTRETVTKILGEFREAGFLELGYRRIVLTNLGGLQGAAETRWA